MTTRRTKPTALTSRPRRRRIVESVLLVVGVVVLLDGLFGERGLVDMIGKDQEYLSAEASLRKMVAANDTLREEIRRINEEDPATIEDLARRLGMIKPGEKAVIFRDVKPPDQ